MSLTDSLVPITKKDDDATLIHVLETDELLLETNQPIDTGIDLEAALPNENLLQDAADAPMIDVQVQLVYFVFVVAAGMALCIMLFGSLPYWLLLKDASAEVVWGLFYGSLALVVMIYGALVFFRKKAQIAVGLLLGWMLALILFTGATAAILQDIAPFQFMTMMWAQTLVIVIYTRLSIQYISTLWALVYMSVASLVVWAISIYAFSIEHDWITAIVLLGCAICAVGYNGFEIHRVQTRFHLSTESKTEAVVCYYVDPIVWVFKLS